MNISQLTDIPTSVIGVEFAGGRHSRGHISTVGLIDVVIAHY
jgi:hypothetical protein